MESIAANRDGSHEKESAFYVAPLLHAFGGLVHRNRAFCIWLGQMESSRLADELKRVHIDMPIYVCGLARSGSTLLHEVICSHPAVATHRIKDFPMVFTPYWWRRATANLRPKAPHERPHRDGMMITTESPDAIEEMLWMAFFPRCHDPLASGVLTSEDSFPGFESFYRSHIRKLLLAERASRYAAKANYHVARLAYLLHLFPDAKFIIPVRSPEGHIVSLMRQQQWFSKGHRAYPRGRAVMRWSGHFEFGLDRRPMNLGDTEKVRRILHAWDRGEEIRGLAIYWDMVYGYLARLLASDARLRAAALVVRFEDLCAAPAETLRSVLQHCALGGAEAVLQGHIANIRYPAYYQSPLVPEDIAIIREETADTASLWGY